MARSASFFGFSPPLSSRVTSLSALECSVCLPYRTARWATTCLSSRFLSASVMAVAITFAGAGFFAVWRVAYVIGWTDLGAHSLGAVALVFLGTFPALFGTSCATLADFLGHT